jgi:hypothetical protein
MHRSLKIAGIVAASAVALVIGLVALLWVGNQGKNERIIVPKGYRGFVGVFYEQPANSTLKKEGGWLLVDFPDTGVLFTSASLNTGWHKKEFFERDGDRLVPMRANLVGPIPSEIPPSERIFTGGATHTQSGVSAAVVYHVGDAVDRAKLDWQSSGQWIQTAFRAKK